MRVISLEEQTALTFGDDAAESKVFESDGVARVEGGENGVCAAHLLPVVGLVELGGEPHARDVRVHVRVRVSLQHPQELQDALVGRRRRRCDGDSVRRAIHRDVVLLLVEHLQH